MTIETVELALTTEEGREALKIYLDKIHQLVRQLETLDEEDDLLPTIKAD